MAGLNSLRGADRRRPAPISPRISLELKFMEVRPLHDRIIVHRLAEGEQQIGRIIIPDTAKEKPQQGTVLAAGNGKANGGGKRVPLDVKAGDHVLFGKYSGQEIKLDGTDYVIMKEDDVLAVIDGPITKVQAGARTSAKSLQRKKK
jgi:chaperonin GroES